MMFFHRPFALQLNWVNLGCHAFVSSFTYFQGYDGLSQFALAVGDGAGGRCLSHKSSSQRI